MRVLKRILLSLLVRLGCAAGLATAFLGGVVLIGTWFPSEEMSLPILIFVLGMAVLVVWVLDFARAAPPRFQKRTGAPAVAPVACTAAQRREAELAAGACAEADRLERERTGAWEYLLFAAALETGLANVRRKFDAWPSERWRWPKRELTLKQLEPETRRLLGELLRLFKEIKSAVECELPPAAGAPGQPGDPSALRCVAARLARCCEELYDWEYAVGHQAPPAWGPDLWGRLPGLTVPWFYQIASLPERIRTVLANAQPGGCYQLKLEFNAPSLAPPMAAKAIGRQVARDASHDALVSLVAVLGGMALGAWLWDTVKTTTSDL